MRYLKKDFIPDILRQQLERCRRAEARNKLEMFNTFAAELNDLWDKKLILLYNRMNIVYLTYFFIMHKLYNILVPRMEKLR